LLLESAGHAACCTCMHHPLVACPPHLPASLVCAARSGRSSAGPHDPVLSLSRGLLVDGQGRVYLTSGAGASATLITIDGRCPLPQRESIYIALSVVGCVLAASGEGAWLVAAGRREPWLAAVVVRCQRALKGKRPAQGTAALQAAPPTAQLPWPLSPLALSPRRCVLRMCAEPVHVVYGGRPNGLRGLPLLLVLHPLRPPATHTGRRQR